MMKKTLLLFCLFAACATGGKAMTRDEFASINIGESIKTVVNNYGKPYSVRSRGNDCDIYEYYEHLSMGVTIVQVKRYYFVVRDDRVVGKYVRFANPPGYEQIYTDDIYPNY